MTAHYALVFLSGTLERLASLPCPMEQSVRWFLRGLCLASGLSNRQHLNGAFRTEVAGLEIWCVADHAARVVRVLKVAPTEDFSTEPTEGAIVIPLPLAARS